MSDVLAYGRAGENGRTVSASYSSEAGDAPVVTVMVSVPADPHGPRPDVFREIVRLGPEIDAAVANVGPWPRA